MKINIKAAWSLFRQKYREVRAEQQGVAMSRARILRPAFTIPELAKALQPGNTPKRPIPGAVVRMLDGAPMAIFTDGSLRHATGFKPGKAARKAAKRARRAAHA